MTKQKLADYYARRAQEYEQIYYRDNPSRQSEQLTLQKAASIHLSGKKVLEVACGTGYWTQFVAQTAQQIVATDFNTEVIQVAKETKHFPNNVLLLKADAFDLPFLSETFTGGLANFWFSHLLTAQRKKFLDHFHEKLLGNSSIFIADNVYNEGVGGTLVSRKGKPDTYKKRILSDGTINLVLKNYPTEMELKSIFGNYAKKLTVFFGKHFWYVKYTLKK